MQLVSHRSLVRIFIIVAGWLALAQGLRAALAPRAAHAAEAGHVVIAEIKTSGATATDEFIELYNPTDATVPLAHWKLQKRTASGSSSNLISDFPAITIASRSALLIAHPTGYASGVVPDLVYTTTASLASDNSVALMDTSGAVVDLVGFGSAKQFETSAAPNPPARGSIERLPGGDAGSGTDTDANAADFVVRTQADPQSSAAAPRPVPPPPSVPQPTPAPISEPLPSPLLASTTPLSTEPVATAPPEPSATPPADPTLSTSIVEIAPTTTDAATTGAATSSASDTITSGETLPTANAFDTTQITSSEPTNNTITIPIIPPRVPRAPVPGNLIINEVMPDPTDGDEWVEIKNVSTDALVLDGLRVADGSTHQVMMSGTIDASAYRAVSFSSATLNNSGDAVILLAGDGSVLDRVSYGDWQSADATVPAPRPGYALARTPDGAHANGISDWKITATPTRETTNVFEAPPAADGAAGGAAGGAAAQLHEEAPPPPPPSLPTITTASSPITYPAGSILISELYPIPYAGEVEWIELSNPGAVAIELDGWSVADARGTKTPLHGSIVAAGYFTLESPRGHLNNDGDSVTIFDPTNQPIDAITYGNEVSRGEAYARGANGWARTVTPTPGSANIITAPESDTPPAAPAAKPQPQTENTLAVAVSKPPLAASHAPRATNKKSARTPLSPKPLTTLRGTISVAPGVLGATIFYLAEGGPRIMSRNITLPTLAIGDRVLVRGAMSTATGEPRLLITKPENIHLLGHGSAPSPSSVEINDLGSDDQGTLVATIGTITQKFPDRLVLEDTSGTITIALLPGAHLDPTAMHIGDAAQVVGIVSQTKKGLRLLPRGREDFTVTEHAAQNTTPATAPHISIPTILATTISAFILAMVVRKYVVHRLANTKTTAPVIL